MLARRALGRALFSTSRASFEVPKNQKSNDLVITDDHISEIPAATLSGAPEELLDRTVRIFKETMPPTQRGYRNTHGWRIDWDVIGTANRWEDPLIGYASSADYMQSVQMHFRTKDDAIRFATNQGWNYYVQEPKQRKIVPKAYGDNFLYSTGKLKYIFTK